MGAGVVAGATPFAAAVAAGLGAAAGEASALGVGVGEAGAPATRWTILAGLTVDSAAGVSTGSLIARSCGFCRHKKANRATDSATPTTSAKMIHGTALRRGPSSREGALGRSASASGGA